MLFLTELSVPQTSVFEVAREVSPLLAPDPRYAIKSWMQTLPGLAMRPWDVITSRDLHRIVGWRAQPPSERDIPKNVRLSVMEFAIEEGEPLDLRGAVIPLRQIGAKDEINPKTGDHIVRRRRQFDAAEGQDDPVDAYRAWLTERLIDVMPSADVDEIAIDDFRSVRGLRKATDSNGHIKRIQRCLIPTAVARISLTVKDSAGVEAWLLHGVGPQKAFGYGAFLPC